jgi:hypothetical protein
MSPNSIITEFVDKLMSDGPGTKLMATAIRLLAEGRPITTDQLARTAGVEPTDVAAAPSVGDIEYDDLASNQPVPQPVPLSA